MIRGARRLYLFVAFFNWPVSHCLSLCRCWLSSSRGGAATAEAMAHAGARVVVSDIQRGAAEVVAGRIRNQDGDAVAMKHDVTREWIESPSCERLSSPAAVWMYW